jgi:hypothetical protein
MTHEDENALLIRTGKLQASFNDVSRYPAQQFEMQTGLSGVAAYYIFPEGFTAARYEDHYSWRFGTGGFSNIPGVLTGSGLPEEHLINPSCRLTLQDFLENVSDGYKHLLAVGWREIERLNPETKNIIFDREDHRQTYSAMRGVTSGFNVDDINLFLFMERLGVPPGLHARSLPGYSEKRTAIENEVGVLMQWVASMPTMEKIHNQLQSPKAMKPKG